MKKDHLLFYGIIFFSIINFKLSNYILFFGWSEITHIIGGIAISLFVKWRWQRIDIESFESSRFLTRFFIISALAIWWLTFWEILEYVIYNFDATTVEIYHDTMRDLMMDFWGTFIASIFLSKNKPPRL